MRASTFIALCVANCACGATHASTLRTRAPATAAPTAPPDAAAAQPTRDLDTNASFGDLVAAARALGEHGAAASDAGCLIARRGTAFHIDADLLPAVHPLPGAPVDLATSLARGTTRARLLTHWGEIGDGAYDLALATFTTTATATARAPAALLVVTHAGVFLRYGDRDASPRDGPLAPDAAVARVGALPEHALYVTAEHDTRLSEVHALLARLPAERPVALAVALPAGTRLPQPASLAETTSQACPGGLPEPVAGATEGDLAPADIVAALAPLREAATQCLQSARSAAIAGGKLTLALRIAPDGRVRDACAAQDGIGDPALIECVVEFVRGVRFPAPSPAGFVDVQLPLDLTSVGPPPQRAICP